MPAPIIPSVKSEPGLPVKVVAVHDPAVQGERLRDLIECCAYELYVEHGSTDGHAVEDWRNAELKMLSAEGRCPVGCIEQENEVDVDAAVEDFNPEDLEVYVGPNRVTIYGCHNQLKCDNCHRSVGEPHPIFGAIEVPNGIEASKATATLKCGMLHIVLPKAAA